MDDQARARARLRDRRARGLPPQELLLPRPAEGLPDLPVRRAALRRRAASLVPERGRRPRGRDRARPPRGGRGEDGSRRRRGRADRRRRAARSSTSTAAARRSSRSSPSPTSARPRTRSASCSCCARRSSSSASPTRRWRRARCAVDANVSVRAGRASELPHAHGAQEHELVQLRRARDRRRGRAADRRSTRPAARSSQETYDFDAATGRLTPHRSKEEAEDYRYFPEPDLVPVEPPAELVERLRARAAGAARERGSAGSRRRVGFELARRARHDRPRRPLRAPVAAGRRRARGRERRHEPARGRGRRPGRGRRRRSSRSSSRRASGSRGRRSPRRSRRAATPASRPTRTSATARSRTTSELEPLVERVLAANPGQVEAYRGGKQGLLGFFVGQVMKETQGKANPRLVNELLRAKLGG